MAVHVNVTSIVNYIEDISADVSLKERTFFPHSAAATNSFSKFFHQDYFFPQYGQQAVVHSCANMKKFLLEVSSSAVSLAALLSREQRGDWCTF